MKPIHLLPLFLLATAAAAQSSATPAPAPAPPMRVGDDKPVWSATTNEAAASEANKKALADAKPALVTGEVVDYSCYLQLAKTGEKHMDCGRKCLLAGQPGGILDASGNLYLIMPEEHHPRRDGKISLKEFLASQIGRQVTASGMLSERNGVKALFVSAMNLPLPPPPAGSAAASAPKQ
jgi:hypothetical protein